MAAIKDRLWTDADGRTRMDGRGWTIAEGLSQVLTRTPMFDFGGPTTDALLFANHAIIITPGLEIPWVHLSFII